MANLKLLFFLFFPRLLPFCQSRGSAFYCREAIFGIGVGTESPPQLYFCYFLNELNLFILYPPTCFFFFPFLSCKKYH